MFDYNILHYAMITVETTEFDERYRKEIFQKTTNFKK